MIRIQLARAELMLAEQRAAEAAQTLQPVVADIRSKPKVVGFLLARAVLESAQAALALGHYADATRLAQEVLTENLRRARDPKLSADVGEASLVLAKAERGAGDAPGAHAAAHQAAVSLTGSLGPDHALTREALALE
jgi:hypothetical protein